MSNIERGLILSFKMSLKEMTEALGESPNYVSYKSVNDITPKDITNVAKQVLKSPLGKYDLSDLLRLTKGSGNDRGNDIIDLIDENMNIITQKAKDPARQEPDYEVIENGNGYQILELHNYAAARQICNKYNLSHCIGSSNTDWFYQYGQKSLRRTYYIITSAGRAVAVHSGKGNKPYLITSHDNENEVANGEDTRGENPRKVIIQDLMSSIPANRVIDVLLGAFPNENHNEVEEIFQEKIDEASQPRIPEEKILYQDNIHLIYVKQDMDQVGIGIEKSSGETASIYLTGDEGLLEYEDDDIGPVAYKSEKVANMLFDMMGITKKEIDAADMNTPAYTIPKDILSELNNTSF